MRRKVVVVCDKIDTVVFHDPYDARCVLRASGLSWKNLAYRLENDRLSVKGVEWLLGIAKQRPRFPQTRLEKWLREPLSTEGVEWWKNYFWRQRRRLLKLLRRALELGEGLIVEL